MEVERLPGGQYQLRGEILDGKDATYNFGRGYSVIGVYEPHNPANVGQLFRSAMAFGASEIFIIGRGSKFKSKTDTCKSYKHVLMREYRDWEQFQELVPRNAEICAIDNNRASRQPKPLERFQHPERCIYLLGPEKIGLPDKIINACHKYVFLQTRVCLNLSVAGSIVLYDRFQKGIANGR